MELNDKIVIYCTVDGQSTVDVRMDGDTVWLSWAQMTELFQKDRTVIGQHINNIYKKQELERETTCANFAHTKNYGYREDCGGESCHAALPRDEKKHSFSDDNIRIAATLFPYFMASNGILYTPDGSKHIDDNAFVALTLMIAKSRTERKDIMIKVVVNLTNKNNYE